MKRFPLWKFTLAGLLLLGLLAGCASGAGTGVSPAPDASPAPAEETQAQPEEAYSEPLEIVETLAQEELEKVNEWLQSGVGPVFWSTFTSPDQVDLAIVLHDGTDTVGPGREFTDEDREALDSIGVDLDLWLSEALGVKLTGEQINEYLERLLGITLTDEELQERIVEQSKTNGWGEWYYTPVNDTYYHFSNGTANRVAVCTEGVRRSDGSLFLTCEEQMETKSYYVELMPQETGYRFLSIELKGDPAIDVEVLSEAELEELGEWLSQPGICELFWKGYEKTVEITLSDVLYDGAGVGTYELTQEEKDALETLGAGLNLDVVKVTTDQIRQVLMGEPFYKSWWEMDRIESLLNGWYYLEDYDAFYHIHSDTMCAVITCTEGVRWTDSGVLVIKCYRNEDMNDPYQVRLNPCPDSYELEYIRRMD